MCSGHIRRGDAAGGYREKVVMRIIKGNIEEEKNQKNAVIKQENISGSESTDGVKSERKFFENGIEQEWLTTSEAAQYLRISTKCLLNLASNGKIPYFKFGRRNRFLLKSLRDLLLAHAKGGAYGY